MVSACRGGQQFWRWWQVRMVRIMLLFCSYLANSHKYFWLWMVAVHIDGKERHHSLQNLASHTLCFCHSIAQTNHGNAKVVDVPVDILPQWDKEWYCFHTISKKNIAYCIKCWIPCCSFVLAQNKSFIIIVFSAWVDGNSITMHITASRISTHYPNGNGDLVLHGNRM